MPDEYGVNSHYRSDNRDDWEGLLQLLQAPRPVFDAVEQVLDEHSAWISRPSREVTERIALAATVAAHVHFTPEGPLN